MKPTNEVREYLAELGKRGGSSRSKRKSAASAANIARAREVLAQKRRGLRLRLPPGGFSSGGGRANQAFPRDAEATRRMIENTP